MAIQNSALSRSAPHYWDAKSFLVTRHIGTSRFPVLSPDFPLLEAANDPTLILLTREPAGRLPRALSLVSLKVVAGAFGAAQSLKDEADHWVQLPEGFAAVPGLFVAQVIGESMNRRTPIGACCLFRGAPSGSRQGKIVLVQRRDVTDAETDGSYTVKRYQSEKHGEGEGWRHERITLLPMSSDPRYKPLVLVPRDEWAVRVVAEWVAVVGWAFSVRALICVIFMVSAREIDERF